jgi:hypothetical protein
VDFGDEACGVVFLEGFGANGVGDFEEPNGFAGREAEVVFAIYFAEVAAVNVEGVGEGDDVGAE